MVLRFEFGGFDLGCWCYVDGVGVLCCRLIAAGLWDLVVALRLVF